MDETTFIPPTASNAGFVTKSGHQSHSDRMHYDPAAVALHLAARIDDDTRQVQQEVSNSANHVVASVERNGIDSRGEINRNGLEGRNNTDLNGVETRRQVREEGLESRTSTERNGAEARGLIKNFGERNQDATERFGLNNRDAIDRNLHAIDKGACENKSATADYGYRNLLSECKTQDMIADYGYRNLLEGQKLEKDILIQACETREIIKDRAHVLERQASDNFAVVTRQAAENSSKIELLGFKHTADIKELANQRAFEAQKQMSDCCCEIKELVRAKADQTDELIRKLDTDRIRDQLNDAKNEIIALKIRGGLTPAPVSAISL